MSAARSFLPAASAFGYPRALSGSHRAFPVSDGSVCVLPYGDRNWRDFFTILGLPLLELLAFLREHGIVKR